MDAPLPRRSFDVDGTLLDTSEFIHRAFEYTLRAEGFPPHDRDEIAHLMGRSLLDCYAHLAPAADGARLCDIHRTFQTKNLGLAHCFPETVATLLRLRDAGVRMAAITTRSKRTSLDTLRLNGIDGFFGVILSGEDVLHLKPHPEPLLKALAVLGVAPSEAVMVGDTASDIEAGRNAGTATIGVTCGFHGEGIREARPDFVVGDIGAVTSIVMGE